MLCSGGSALTTFDDARHLALSLPETTWDGAWRFSVAGKAFAWSWLERIDPRMARVPNPDVLVVWVASEEVKFGLAEAEPEKYFTEPHYDGYRAVMVRLTAITNAELRDLLGDAWRLRAPRAALKRLEAQPPR